MEIKERLNDKNGKREVVIADVVFGCKVNCTFAHRNDEKALPSVKRILLSTPVPRDANRGARI